MVAQIDRSDITHVECHGCLGCPTALAVKVGHTQFIDPNDATLGRGRIVAYTNEHHTHLAQRRITHHINLIIGMVIINILITDTITHTVDTGHLVSITVFLGVDQNIEIDVKHILLRPNLEAVT